MDVVKIIAGHAVKLGFLRGAIALSDGQPRIVGKTPWQAYRGDLEHRIGSPDHEGIQEWLAQEGLEFEPGCFGPATLHRIFREIATSYESEKR